MTRPVAHASFIRQPLDVILGSTAGVRVMRALLAHGGFLPVSRIAQDTKITRNGVRDSLGLLERAGAVEAIGSARTRLFRARSGNPLVAALDAVFGAEQKRFDDILLSITEAASLPQVAGLWLFGSVARGEDTIGSDLDLAVVIDVPAPGLSNLADQIRDRLLVHAAMLSFSPTLIAMTPGDVKRLRDQRSPIWSEFLRDARVLRGAAPQAILVEAACEEVGA